MTHIVGHKWSVISVNTYQSWKGPPARILSSGSDTRRVMMTVICTNTVRFNPFKSCTIDVVVVVTVLYVTVTM